MAIGRVLVACLKPCLYIILHHTWAHMVYIALSLSLSLSVCARARACGSTCLDTCHAHAYTCVCTCPHKCLCEGGKCHRPVQCHGVHCRCRRRPHLHGTCRSRWCVDMLYIGSISALPTACPLRTPIPAQWTRTIPARPYPRNGHSFGNAEIKPISIRPTYTVPAQTDGAWACATGIWSRHGAWTCV